MFAAQLPILELQYLDETGSKGAMQLHAPIGTTYAEIDASALAVASIFASITGCVLIRQRILFKAVTNPKETAAAGSSIKRQGAFVFEDETGEKQSLIAVPGILDSVLVETGVSAGIAIDTTNSDIVSFVTLYIDGIWCNPFSDDMIALVAAYRQSRV